MNVCGFSEDCINVYTGGHRGTTNRRLPSPPDTINPRPVNPFIGAANPVTGYEGVVLASPLVLK